MERFENWTWGLSLIGATIIVHAVGIVAMAVVLSGLRARIEAYELGSGQVFAILILLVGTVGLLLAVLHGFESVIWAAAYLWLGAVDTPHDAILYSVDSMTTRGASGLDLHPSWRMMGALEAADGMLLFGISTAFLFTVMQAYWPTFSHRRQHRS
jgi:hypothetical protein